jgi:hypothetical protein
MGWMNSALVFGGGRGLHDGNTGLTPAFSTAASSNIRIEDTQDLVQRSFQTCCPIQHDVRRSIERVARPRGLVRLRFSALAQEWRKVHKALAISLRCFLVSALARARPLLSGEVSPVLFVLTADIFEDISVGKQVKHSLE